MCFSEARVDPLLDFCMYKSFFPLFQSSVQFDVRADVCVSGTSPESVSRLLEELAQYGTHYLRLSRFSLGSADKKGLVFQVMALRSAPLTLGFYVKDEAVFSSGLESDLVPILIYG